MTDLDSAVVVPRVAEPGRKARPKAEKYICQVPGCTKGIPRNVCYYIRYKVCRPHATAESLLFNGAESRFCQQCGRFQPLSEFDGSRRSCRAKLLEHNTRRKQGGAKKMDSLLGQASSHSNMTADDQTSSGMRTRLQKEGSSKPRVSYLESPEAAEPLRLPSRTAAAPAGKDNEGSLSDTNTCGVHALDRGANAVEKRQQAASPLHSAGAASGPTLPPRAPALPAASGGTSANTFTDAHARAPAKPPSLEAFFATFPVSGSSSRSNAALSAPPEGAAAAGVPPYAAFFQMPRVLQGTAQTQLFNGVGPAQLSQEFSKHLEAFASAGFSIPGSVARNAQPSVPPNVLPQIAPPQERYRAPEDAMPLPPVPPSCLQNKQLLIDLCKPAFSDEIVKLSHTLFRAHPSELPPCVLEELQVIADAPCPPAMPHR